MFLRKWLIQKEVLENNDGSEHAIGILVLCAPSDSVHFFLDQLEPYPMAFHGNEKSLLKKCMEHKVILITNYSTMSSRNRIYLQQIMGRRSFLFSESRHPMQTVFMAVVDDLSFLKSDRSNWKNWVVKADELDNLLEFERLPGETHYLNKEETAMAIAQFR